MNKLLEPGAAAQSVVAEQGSQPTNWLGTISRKQLIAIAVVIGSVPFIHLGASFAALHWLSPKSPPVTVTAVSDGHQLYVTHCASCHGIRGDANGISSAALDPPARYFGKERFRIASTANGNPTDDDLLFVIRNGIPGAAMPAFSQLSDADCQALIAEVRARAYTGLRDKLIKRFEPEGGIDGDELGPLVARLSHPGEPVAVPNPMPPTSPDSVARGRTLFAANCASCHGPEGRGDGPQVKDMKDEDGRPTRPRNLTNGLYKGGGAPERLYTRLAVGMPGTPMPACATLKPEEICSLVHYVQSLAAPASNVP